jgi:HEPN domain-containing protein
MKDDRVAAFMTLSREELAAAEKLKDILPRQAAYFLQQAVEKMVRAVLEHEGIPAGTAHNLHYLAGLLPSEHALRSRFAAFEHLSAAATRYRYPSPSGSLSRVSAEDVGREFASVAGLLGEVARWLSGSSQRK